jgi:hypothetical protein
MSSLKGTTLGKIKLRRFDISRSTLICHFCFSAWCLRATSSVQTMFPCHNVWSLNQLIWFIDLLFIFLFITECWSFYFLNHERKLFSVIRMSKEPSQLHNMVKQRYSGRRGYNPCWIIQNLKCAHGFGCPSNWKTLYPIFKEKKIWTSSHTVIS